MAFRTPEEGKRTVPLVQLTGQGVLLYGQIERCASFKLEGQPYIMVIMLGSGTNHITDWVKWIWMATTITECMQPPAGPSPGLLPMHVGTSPDKLFRADL